MVVLLNLNAFLGLPGCLVMMKVLQALEEKSDKIGILFRNWSKFILVNECGHDGKPIVTWDAMQTHLPFGDYFPESLQGFIDKR